MAKEKVQAEENQGQKVNPIADVIKSIAGLSQADRLVLYSRLDTIMNDDRDKASQGVDGNQVLFDEAIKSLNP